MHFESVPIDVTALLGEVAAPGHRPYVVLKFAQTLDGRIATASGDAKWISGEKSLTVNFEDDVVKSMMAHAIPVPENPKLTQENLGKIKRGTTTFKEVVELFGEPTTKSTTKEGKLRSALWMGGIKNVNIDFEDDVVRSIKSAGLR